MHAEVVCSQCGEPIELRDVTADLGPGYPDRWRPGAVATGRFATSVDDE